MASKEINNLVRWWLTPKFPKVHILEETSGVPAWVKKWIIHPIKRRIAKYYLVLLQKATNIKVIAITGSAGKTTTKEMVASILKREGPTVWSKANIDPVYNIPTTILTADFNTKYLVLEMGVEYPDEMNFYLWMARPDIGVITNIFPTHLEFLGNIQGVLKEKTKLIFNLPKWGVAILNSGDKLLKQISDKVKVKTEWFKPDGDPLVQNENTARKIAEVLGISDAKIKDGIKNYDSAGHRLNQIKHKSGALILDDTYNSNPEAVISTLYYFEKLSKNKKRIAVLGDMLELGDFEKEAHIKIGRIVSDIGFNAVIGVGSAIKYTISEIEKRSPKTETTIVEKGGNVLSVVKPYLKKGNAILFKGSRSIGLEKVVDSLS